MGQSILEYAFILVSDMIPLSFLSGQGLYFYYGGSESPW